MLFDVSPVDPSTLGCEVLVLAAIACVAHWIPLRRALRVDPAIALREE
jgi:putative ABC transport system permease protein